MNTPEYYKRQIRIRNFIIGILLIPFAFAAYLFLIPDTSAQWSPSATNATALEHIRDYRRLKLSLHKKTRVIWYKPEDIRKYLDEDYPRLISKMEGRPGYTWAVGFYFMRHLNKEDIPRNNYYVIPTLIGPDGSPLDFYDTANNKAYYKFKGATTLGMDDVVSYNTGHLWP